MVYDYEKAIEKWRIAKQKDEFYITWVALSNNGEILATTSSEGKTVRLFSTSDGSNLSTFTRGSFPANFNFLKFQWDDTRLVVSSDLGTVHIFIVDNKSSSGIQPKNAVSSFSFLKGLVPYLGKIGSFWKFKIDAPVSISIMPSLSCIISLSMYGKIYIGRINVEEGGEAELEAVNTLNEHLVPSETVESLRL